MRTYVYCWEVSVREGIDVEIRVTAESAPAARRQLDSLLGEMRPFLGRDGRDISARAPLRRFEAREAAGAGECLGNVPTLLAEAWRAFATESRRDRP